MPRKYEYFYAPDYLSVGATEQLTEVPTAFEASFSEESRFPQPSPPSGGGSVAQPEIIYAQSVDVLNASGNEFIVQNVGLKPTDFKYYGNAYIFGGCKFENHLLRDGDKYKQLGLYANGDFANLNFSITKRIYRSFSNAASLQIFYEAAFTLKAVDPTKTFPPYGTLYKTYVPYSGRFLFNTVRAIIESWSFNFGDADNPITYTVAEGSVKIKRSRKTNPL